MSLAARAAFRRLRIRRPNVLLLIALSTSLTLAACSSAAPSPTPQKPQATSVPKDAQQNPAAKPSPGASPAASPSPSPSPSPAPLLSIVDPTLADATPWISLRLSDGESRIVSGWRLEVGAESITIPGNAIIQPGDQLILHVGEGRSSDREVFLGANSEGLALAAAPGATVRLLSDTGEVVAQTTVPRY